MALVLELESPAVWTEEKRDLLAKYPGRFNLLDSGPPLGTTLEGRWYRLVDDSEFWGFAWACVPEPLEDGDPIDPTIEEIELCLASPGKKHGGQLLGQLEADARNRGVVRLEGRVRGTNPEALRILAWLERNGYELNLPAGWSRATAESAVKRGKLRVLELAKDLKPSG
jgi:GNAT superfamily N-acetyltransferase